MWPITNTNENVVAAVRESPTVLRIPEVGEEWEMRGGVEPARGRGRGWEGHGSGEKGEGGV